MAGGIGKGVKLPNFLGIGTQKGGTTYLHGLLKQHPQVFLAQPKELHYFSLHHQFGLKWYSRYFEAASLKQHCGEVTPYYLFHPLAAERIAVALPDVKLIVLLRDPVERALSQYFHSKRLGLEPLELEEALKAEPERLAGAEAALKQGETHAGHQQHSYLSRSCYEKQLPKYQAFFGSSQLLVMRSEDLFQMPSRAWDKVLNFLELRDVACPELELRHFYSGEGESLRVSPDIRRHLLSELGPTYAAMQQQYQLSWDVLDQ